jgi:hypothetical protein
VGHLGAAKLVSDGQIPRCLADRRLDPTPKVVGDRTGKTASLPWDLMNVTSHTLGEAEGWWLSERDDGRYEIQRFNEDPVAHFASDNDAYQHVCRCAQAGGILHIEALARHGKPYLSNGRLWKTEVADTDPSLTA